MRTLSDLKIQIFADGADLAGMVEMYKNPIIKGFTTNPTLMRKAGVVDYKEFAAKVVQSIPDLPISFEVLDDDFEEMARQATILSNLGPNVYVKIPITNTKGQSSIPLIHRLSYAGMKLNVTAVMTTTQVYSLRGHIFAPAYVSVFAGRIADTGTDPLSLMATVVGILRPTPNIETIWASPREILNIFQANIIGCPIITVTNDLLKKLDTIGKDLTEFSLDTVKMFYNDAIKAGYTL